MIGITIHYVDALDAEWPEIPQAGWCWDFRVDGRLWAEDDFVSLSRAIFGILRCIVAYARENK